MITKFKLYENLNTPLFINESKLKDELMKKVEFAEGDIAYALTDIVHDEWHNHKDWGYEDACNWMEINMGDLPLLAMYLLKYDYQVCNGGHYQYYDNGFASTESSKRYGIYEDLDIHDEFISLFKILKMDKILPSGEQAYKIINNFSLDLEDVIEECGECNGTGQERCRECDGDGHKDCDNCGGEGEVEEVECTECDGDGTIKCDECDGKGEFECGGCDGSGEVETGEKKPDTGAWEKLDDAWYIINDDVTTEFNNYLKSLTLDGEKIEDLVELANQTQKYNL